MSRHIPDTLRRLVAERAGGRCEYCQISEAASFYPFHVDHIISLKHGGLTEASNLAWSCFACNCAKGSDVGTVLAPRRIFIRLFDPRRDSWKAHFSIENSQFVAKTTIAAATIKLLQLNSVERIIERQWLEQQGRV